jgi:hypothetical protein
MTAGSSAVHEIISNRIQGASSKNEADIGAPRTRRDPFERPSTPIGPAHLQSVEVTTNDISKVAFLENMGRQRFRSKQVFSVTLVTRLNKELSAYHGKYAPIDKDLEVRNVYHHFLLNQ